MFVFFIPGNFIEHKFQFEFSNTFFISKTIKWENLKIAFVDKNWSDTNKVNIAVLINNPKSTAE